MIRSVTMDTMWASELLFSTFINLQLIILGLSIRGQIQWIPGFNVLWYFPNLSTIITSAWCTIFKLLNVVLSTSNTKRLNMTAKAVNNDFSSSSSDVSIWKKKDFGFCLRWKDEKMKTPRWSDVYHPGFKTLKNEEDLHNSYSLETRDTATCNNNKSHSREVRYIKWINSTSIVCELGRRSFSRYCYPSTV